MSRVVRGGLIQATLCEPATSPIDKIKRAMLDKHEELVAQAAGRGANIVCLQELFYGPYFCAEQQPKWYELTERIPDGPTTRRFSDLAKKHGIVLVLPMYEEEITGLYYNTAAVIDADGTYLGKFRKVHLPQVLPGFWEKYYFRPGNLGYPVFKTKFANVGVYICYDRHFPEGWRALGLNGAEIVFNPSATSRGLSNYLWKLEQTAAAVANEYFVGTINRVGIEDLGDDDFYGTSYFADPEGKPVDGYGSDSAAELMVRDLDMDLLREVRNRWQFYRDRRPDAYGDLVRP